MKAKDLPIERDYTVEQTKPVKCKQEIKKIKT